jgi:hypothetical protein
LDILLVVKENKKSETGEAVYKLIALKNEYYDDVYFLKVMVIPGKCAVSRCPFGSLVSRDQIYSIPRVYSILVQEN